jgi:hypothetical protein
MNLLRINKIAITKRSYPLFFFLVFFLSTSLFGKINLSQTSGDSKYAAVAVNAAGEIMVVWTEWSSGQNYYSLYRGGQWSSPRNCGITSQQAWTNELAVDSQGRFHLTFADGYSSYSRDIVYSYWTGSSWASPNKIYVSPYNSAWNRMAIDKNDYIHVLWYHSHIPKTDGTYHSDVVTMKKPKNGSWPTNYENISREGTTESICPSIAVRSGHVYASWMGGTSSGFPWNLNFSEKSSGGWSTPKALDWLGYYPAMVVDNSGNVHIAHSLKNGNFYCISRIGGNWRPKEVISNGNAPLQFGYIAHNDNVVVAAWVQGKNGNWAIYASSKIGSNNWGIPVKIADTPGGEDGNKHVHVALDNKNCAHFVWHGTGVGGKTDCFYEKYPFDTPKDATFIELDNSYLYFQTDDNTSNPSPQTFRVRASGAGSINYTLSNNKSWSSVSPMQGASSGEWISHTVSVDASNLSDSSYFGTITVTDPSAYNNPVEVGVSLTVGEEGGDGGEANFEVDKASLEFSIEEGKNPAAKSFNLRAAGGKSLGFKISTNKPWLSASPNKGTAGETWIPVSVSIDAEDKHPGTYSGRVTISATGTSESRASVLVSLTIEKRKKPFIYVNKTHFNFWGYANGDNPSFKTFIIKNSGSLTLNYRITPNKGWIKVNPTEGDSKGEADTIKVSVDNSGLGVNKHKGKIQITAPGAENSPQDLSVEFEVVLPPQPYPPVSVTVKKINHEGLIIQKYKSEISWKANPRNQNLFNIVKYRIFRKDRDQSNSSFVYIDEVAGNNFTYYDGDFSSKEERNKFAYAVVSVDAAGKESQKTEALGDNSIRPSVFFEERVQSKKGLADHKKLP